jgi:citrate lyase synthetase
MRTKTSLGLIAMSAKPFHAGHFYTIQIAAYECDEVHVYTSTTDRASDGFTVRGDLMSKIWHSHIIPVLPSNASVCFVKNPLQSIIEALINKHAHEELHVYSGADRAHKFDKLPAAVQEFKLRVLDRELITASGTACRQALQCRDFSKFQAFMPKCLDAKLVWEILLS